MSTILGVIFLCLFTMSAGVWLTYNGVERCLYRGGTVESCKR